MTTGTDEINIEAKRLFVNLEKYRIECIISKADKVSTSRAFLNIDYQQLFIYDRVKKDIYRILPYNAPFSTLSVNQYILLRQSSNELKDVESNILTFDEIIRYFGEELRVYLYQLFWYREGLKERPKCKIDMVDFEPWETWK